MSLRSSIFGLIVSFISAISSAQQPPRLYESCTEHTDGAKCLLFCRFCGAHCRLDCEHYKEEAKRDAAAEADCKSAKVALKKAFAEGRLKVERFGEFLGPEEAATYADGMSCGEAMEVATSELGWWRPSEVAAARSSLHKAEESELLPKQMDARQIAGLSDDEAIAHAELWTDFVASGTEKEKQIERGRRVAKLATSLEGSDTYAGGGGDERYPFRCNRFVYDVLTAAGLPVPLRERWGGLLEAKYPPLAGDYANPKYEIPGLPVVNGQPRVGDVVAIADDTGNASGHVGIVVSYDTRTGEGKSIYVGSAVGNKVVVGKFGFRDRDRGAVFRRPTW